MALFYAENKTDLKICIKSLIKYKRARIDLEI
jgi:hypothetical protein